MEWRREFGVAELRSSDFGDMPREIFAGRDEQGRLIVVLRLADLDGRSFEQMERFLRWRVMMQEALNAQLNFASGDPRYTLVLNCEGFTKGHVSRAARRCAKELSRVTCDNYPDFLNQIWVCNPPPVFVVAFGVLRPFLPANFVNMIRVHNGDEESCLDVCVGRTTSVTEEATTPAQPQQQQSRMCSVFGGMPSLAFTSS